MTIPDKQELLSLWEERGQPEIPLPHGGGISALDRFLAYCEDNDMEADVEMVRRHLAVSTTILGVSPDDD